MSLESIQARLQTATAEYQKLQAELSNVVEARQRLDTQLQENELVKKARCVDDLEANNDAKKDQSRSLLC
jgi:chaperonin cofactor prefoldin